MIEELQKAAEIISDVRFEILDLEKKINSLNNKLYEAEKSLRYLFEGGHQLQLDPLLSRQVVEKLLIVDDLKEACRAVAYENEISFDTVYFAFIHAKKLRNVLDHYGTAFACLRLKKRGLNANQISDLLGISKVHYYKLIKKISDKKEITGKDLIRGYF